MQFLGLIQLLIWVTLVLQCVHTGTLMLRSRRSKQPPVMIGPIMIHQHKRKEDYHFLAASLVGLNVKLKEIKAIGTDGEVAISTGVQVQFTESKHVLLLFARKKQLKEKATGNWRSE